MDTVATGTPDDDDIPDVEIVGPRFSIMPEALLYDPEISPLAKVVYGVLRRHGETPDTCYPSRERLSGFLGVSARSLQRPIVELEEAGWIERRRRFVAGKEISSGYVVHGVGRVQERALNPGVGRAQTRGPGRAQERDRKRASTNESTSTRVPKLDPLLGFDDFWRIYPARRGRKIGKAKCAERWKKLSLDDRRAAWRGARRYAEEVGEFARDPDRFLRDRTWEDFQDPPDVTRPGSAPGVTPFDSPEKFLGNHVYDDPEEDAG